MLAILLALDTCKCRRRTGECRVMHLSVSNGRPFMILMTGGMHFLVSLVIS